jgi:hypothetical protein
MLFIVIKWKWSLQPVKIHCFWFWNVRYSNIDIIFSELLQGLQIQIIMFNYEKNFSTVIVNNSTNINKTNNDLSPQLTEHKTDHDI